MSNLHTKRLGSGDLELARRTITLMAEVFEEPYEQVSDAYLEGLLSRPDFWIIAALEGDQPIGGLTGYTLPMTRTQSSEVFIYDLAIHQDHQRKGIGRLLVNALLKGAQAEGIESVFVPADNEDEHAIEFYRAIGGVAQPVTIFNFDSTEHTDGS